MQQAEQARVERYAPITLARARQLLEKASRELTESRYDPDLPRRLAREEGIFADDAPDAATATVPLRLRDALEPTLTRGGAGVSYSAFWRCSFSSASLYA